MLDLLSKGTVNGTAWRLKKDGKVRNQVTFHDGMGRNIDTVGTHTTQLDVTVFTANMHSWTMNCTHNVQTNPRQIRESILDIVTVWL